MTKISMIAAVAQNGAIGYKNRLLYWLPDDLKRFKALTTGHTVIMGSNTFRSLPKGALPNRRNIVLSRKESLFPGAEHFTSLEAALASCQNDEVVYIIGGESLYRTALPLADELCLTLIDDTPQDADAFFPPFDKSEWIATEEQIHDKDDRHDFHFTFVTYNRKK